MSDSVMSIDNRGNKFWRNSKGKFHRIDGPAIERANGGKEWLENGKRHRTDGPAVEYANGTKEWWVKGRCHRTDGPSVEFFNGDKVWWVNGKRHRIDGPAIEWANGHKVWYVNDAFLGNNEEGFWSLWDILTPEQKKDPVLLSYLPGDFHV